MTLTHGFVKDLRLTSFILLLLFFTFINGIVVLILLSICPKSVYRNTIDLCLLSCNLAEFT